MDNIRRKRKVKDFTGHRFGRLVVLKECEKITFPCGHKERAVSCLCDCGNKKIVQLRSLKSGHTKSCGCYNKEQTLKANQSHKMTHERIYRIWTNIKTRSSNLQAFSVGR